MKEFKGRVINKGYYKGEAVVSHQGVNTLATFQKSAIAKAKQVIVADQNNKDIFEKNITGKALCLPQTIGSTTGGMILFCAKSLGKCPSCLLFSEHIDSLACAGAVLAANWCDEPIVTVDCLGQEFLDYVKDGMQITVDEDGTVTVE